MDLKRIWAFLSVLLIVSLVIPASAQEPLPDDLLGCEQTNDFGGFIVGILGGATAGSGLKCASNKIEQSQLKAFYDKMKEAADQINALPDEIEDAGPGLQITAIVAAIGEIAGYVKWLFSPNTAQELLGRTFAPIGINILVIFTMTVAMVAIYITINMVVFTIKMIVWLMNQILKLLPFW